MLCVSLVWPFTFYSNPAQHTVGKGTATETCCGSSARLFSSPIFFRQLQVQILFCHRVILSLDFQNANIEYIQYYCLTFSTFKSIFLWYFVKLCKSLCFENGFLLSFGIFRKKSRSTTSLIYLSTNQRTCFITIIKVTKIHRNFIFVILLQKET